MVGYSFLHYSNNGGYLLLIVVLTITLYDILASIQGTQADHDSSMHDRRARTPEQIQVAGI